MVLARGSKDYARYGIVTKLIRSAALAADSDKECRAESAVKADRVIQLFTSWTTREDHLGLSHRAIEVNRPYLGIPHLARQSTLPLVRQKCSLFIDSGIAAAFSPPKGRGGYSFAIFPPQEITFAFAPAASASLMLPARL